MSLSKRDYQLIAGILRDKVDQQGGLISIFKDGPETLESLQAIRDARLVQRTLRNVARSLAAEFAISNPSFDLDRFLIACRARGEEKT